MQRWGQVRWDENTKDTDVDQGYYSCDPPFDLVGKVSMLNNDVDSIDDQLKN